MKWIAHLLALAFMIALGTWIVGWWTVPVLAGGYGVWQVRARAAVWTATLAGVLAWTALLVFDAAVGPVGRMSSLLGDMVHTSHATFAVLTVCFAALLCASAATFARTLRRLTLPS